MTYQLRFQECRAGLAHDTLINEVDCDPKGVSEGVQRE